MTNYSHSTRKLETWSSAGIDRGFSMEKRSIACKQCLANSVTRCRSFASSLCDGLNYPWMNINAWKLTD